MAEKLENAEERADGDDDPQGDHDISGIPFRAVRIDGVEQQDEVAEDRDRALRAVVGAPEGDGGIPGKRGGKQGEQREGPARDQVCIQHAAALFRKFPAEHDPQNEHRDPDQQKDERLRPGKEIAVSRGADLRGLVGVDGNDHQMDEKRNQGQRQQDGKEQPVLLRAVGFSGGGSGIFCRLGPFCGGLLFFLRHLHCTFHF